MAFRKKILMLATKISIECGTYMGVTPSDPEYMILDPVVTDEMADVGMHVKVRSPRHIEEIAKKAKVSVDYAQEQVNKLADCGHRPLHSRRVYRDMHPEIERNRNPVLRKRGKEGSLHRAKQRGFIKDFRECESSPELCHDRGVIALAYHYLADSRTAACILEFTGIIRILGIESEGYRKGFAFLQYSKILCRAVKLGGE